jgi:similar to stage IV sporulation protein
MGNQEMIHWWEGYVVVKVQGQRIERLINRMMNQRLAAWNISRTGEAEAQFSIALKDFFQIRSLLKETGCQARVIKKIGLPFLIKRTKRRIGLFGGAIAFCLLLYLFSMMIWSVEIEGVALPENEQYLRQELAKMGVQPGRFKFQVEERQILQRRIMEAIPDTTWVGFQFNGTTALLKVVEKTLPDIREPTNPRHLVAKKKAIIYDLFVEKGQAMVKPNQFVKPGDILVSGIIGTEESPIIVSATGKVLGEVWYEGSVSVPFVQKHSILTGEQKKRYYLNLGPFSLKLWGFGSIPFDQFETDQDTYSLSWKEWSLPLSWKTEQIEATQLVSKQLTEEEAFSLGVELSRQNLYRNLQPEAEIIEENVLRKEIENGKVYIKMHYTVIEEIASEQLIIQGD